MRAIQADIHIWDANVGGGSYRMETAGRIDLSPTVLVAMLRRIADDIEQEYSEKK